MHTIPFRFNERQIVLWIGTKKYLPLLSDYVWKETSMKKIKTKPLIYSWTPLQKAIGLRQENWALHRSPVRSCPYQAAGEQHLPSGVGNWLQKFPNTSQTPGHCAQTEHEGHWYFSVQPASPPPDSHNTAPLSAVNSNSGHGGPVETKLLSPNKPVSKTKQEFSLSHSLTPKSSFSPC